MEVSIEDGGMPLEDVELSPRHGTYDNADTASAPAPPLASAPAPAPAGKGQAAAPRSFIVTALSCVAIGLTVVTYYEDALRAVTRWHEQVSFISDHTHTPYSLACLVLGCITSIQLASLAMVVPPTAVPSMAKPIIVTCVAVAASVCRPSRPSVCCPSQPAERVSPVAAERERRRRGRA